MAIFRAYLKSGDDPGNDEGSRDISDSLLEQREVSYMEQRLKFILVFTLISTFITCPIFASASFAVRRGERIPVVGEIIQFGPIRGTIINIIHRFNPDMAYRIDEYLDYIQARRQENIEYLWHFFT